MCCLCYFQPHILLTRIKEGTTEKERDELKRISIESNFTSTLLPIKTVGVQVKIIN